MRRGTRPTREDNYSVARRGVSETAHRTLDSRYAYGPPLPRGHVPTAHANSLQLHQTHPTNYSATFRTPIYAQPSAISAKKTLRKGGFPECVCHYVTRQGAHKSDVIPAGISQRVRGGLAVGRGRGGEKRSSYLGKNGNRKRQQRPKSANNNRQKTGTVLIVRTCEVRIVYEFKSLGFDTSGGFVQFRRKGDYGHKSERNARIGLRTRELR